MDQADYAKTLPPKYLAGDALNEDQGTSFAAPKDPKAASTVPPPVRGPPEGFSRVDSQKVCAAQPQRSFSRPTSHPSSTRIPPPPSPHLLRPPARAPQIIDDIVARTEGLVRPEDVPDHYARMLHSCEIPEEVRQHLLILVLTGDPEKDEKLYSGAVDALIEIIGKAGWGWEAGYAGALMRSLLVGRVAIDRAKVCQIQMAHPGARALQPLPKPSPCARLAHLFGPSLQPISSAGGHKGTSHMRGDNLNMLICAPEKTKWIDEEKIVRGGERKVRDAAEEAGIQCANFDHALGTGLPYMFSQAKDAIFGVYFNAMDVPKWCALSRVKPAPLMALLTQLPCVLRSIMYRRREGFTGSRGRGPSEREGVGGADLTYYFCPTCGGYIRGRAGATCGNTNKACGGQQRGKRYPEAQERIQNQILDDSRVNVFRSKPCPACAERKGISMCCERVVSSC